MISNIDANGQVISVVYGPVQKSGLDFPSGRNFAQYLDIKGLLDTLHFFCDHKTMFLNIFVTVQQEVSQRVVAVGCERFFIRLSGYVSQPLWYGLVFETI